MFTESNTNSYRFINSLKFTFKMHSATFITTIICTYKLLVTSILCGFVFSVISNVPTVSPINGFCKIWSSMHDIIECERVQNNDTNGRTA